jgi:stearoyl-CoA desaturase (delta-9 desaturase)
LKFTVGFGTRWCFRTAKQNTDKNTAKDNGFLVFLTFGEGYHNYHHIFESDYRNSIRWWLFDPTKWLIKTCQWVGLTKKIRTSPEDKIEKMRIAVTLKRSKEKLIAHPNAEQALISLQQEYDLMTQRKELNRHLEVQRHRWQIMTAKLA